MDQITRDRLLGLIKEFLTWCEVDMAYSTVTISGKYNKLINLQRWCESEKKDLTIETLKEYKIHLYERRMARPEADRIRVLSGIRTDFKSNLLPFFTWCLHKGYLTTDWKKEIDLPPAHRKDPPILADEIIDKIILLPTEPGETDSKWSRARKLEYREAMLFIARTGCRIGAVFNLKQEDVTVSTRSFRVLTKGKIRYLRFTEDLVPMMERRCKGTGQVFNMRSANQQQMNEYLHRGCKLLGLAEGIAKQITVHTLRHCRASNMLGQGINMYVVQKSLGHESIKTTIDTYGHLDTAAAKTALDMNPQVQKALNINQRRANIRSIMEMGGLTRLSGTNVKFVDTKKGMIVKFEIED